MTKDTLIQILKKNRFMRTPEEVGKFDSALDTLAQNIDIHNDISYLPDLFLLFNDITDYQEVMWGLLHLTEVFEAEPSMEVFINIAPILMEQSEEWATRIQYRILNDKKLHHVYKSALDAAPEENRKIINQLLDTIASESETGKQNVAVFRTL